MVLSYKTHMYHSNSSIWKDWSCKSWIGLLNAKGNASVTYGYDIQDFQADLLPLPRNCEVVSHHPVKAWKKGSEIDISFPKS